MSAAIIYKRVICTNVNRLCLFPFISIFSLLLIAGGCSLKDETGCHIGHSNYLLGQFSFDKTNVFVDADFIMPDASHVFVCLVLDGTDVTDARQTQEILKFLQKVKLKLEMFNAGCTEPSWRAVLSKDDLGQAANWYAPKWAFVINPPLITYGTGRVVAQRQKNTNDLEGLDFRPGERYRLMLKVEDPSEFTNNVQVRMDFWGIQVGKREKGDGVKL